MKPLNRDAVRLLKTAVGEAFDEPTLADKLRVRQAMVGRLSVATGASVKTAGMSTAQAAKLVVVGKYIWPIATVGMLAVGGGYFSYRSSRSSGAGMPSHSTKTLVLPSVHPPAKLPESSDSDARGSKQDSVPKTGSLQGSTSDLVQKGPRGEARAVKVKSTSDPEREPTKGTLEAETLLLRQTHADIRAGRAEQALERLREYDQRFARGTLRAEHQAARVLALCRLGRQKEARAEARRFLERWPNSPLAPRIRTACEDP